MVDSSGNGVAFTSGSVSYVSGKFGQCSSIVTAPSQHAINTTGEFAKIHNLLGDYTIDFWLDFDSFNAQYQGIGMYFGRTASYSNILGMSISRGSYGAFTLDVFYQAGATIVASSVTSTFGWKHVCAQKQTAIFICI